MLSIIQVGHNEASDRYIRNKIKAIENAGMTSKVINLQDDCTTYDVLTAITDECNNDGCVAIMVQLPLPAHLDKDMILNSIPADMDIDGLNQRGVMKPLTPCAIMRWLQDNDIELSGKIVTILGRSKLVGLPLAELMIEAGATVTVLNSKTPEQFRQRVCACSDVVISAVGAYGVVDTEHINSDRKQIVIDVGINRNAEGKLCGDVSTEAKQIVERNGGICTPVPGGVGKWTVQELIYRLEEMERAHNG